MKGIFITFEGSEGSGKSTHSGLLYNFLKEKGCPVLKIREPGSTKISEKIREILLDYKNKLMSANCEMLLYMAARAQIVSQIIKPALAKGNIVICDRFLDSTIAYQGYGLGMDINRIRTIGDFVNDGLTPNLTIFLDLPAKQGLKNCHEVKNCKDRIEKRPLSYHERVRNGYLKLAALEPGRIKVVKVEQKMQATQDKIRDLILSIL
jgi:dTMP kinase